MQEVKKIGLMPTAKIAGLFGLVLGVVSILLSKVVCAINPEVATLSGINCAALTWFVLVGIIYLGIICFFGGLVIAALYNLFAGWVGGIKIDFGKK